MLFRYRLGAEIRQGVVTAIRMLGPGGEGGIYELDLEDGTTVQAHGSDLDATYPEWRSYLKEDAMGWGEPLQPSGYVKWDKPKVVVGKVLGSEEKIGANQKPYTIYTLDADGEEIRLSGTTMLSDLLEQVEPGTLVRIEYKGERPVAGGRLKEFEVRPWDESVPAPATPEKEAVPF